MNAASRRWRDRPWGTKVALLLVASAILPLVIVTLYYDDAAERRLVEAVRAQNLQRARGTAEVLDRYLAGVTADLRVLSMAPATGDFLMDRGDAWALSVTDVVLRQAQSIHGYNALYLTDERGTVLASTAPRLRGRNYGAEPYFAAAVDGAFAVHGPRVDPDDQQEYANVSGPVRRGTGPLLGTAVVRVTLDEIDQVIAADSNYAGRGEYGVLLDEGGATLSHPADPSRVLQRIGQLGTTPRRLLQDPRGDPHLRVATSDGATYATLVPLRGQRWVYGLFTREDDVLAMSREQTRRNLLLAFMTGLLAIATAVAAAGWVSRPLKRVRDAANAIAGGDFTRRVGLDQRDEVGQLGDAFDRMADALAAKDAELRRHADTLEQQVEARTAALQTLASQIDAERRRVDNIISTVPGVVWEAWGQPDVESQRIDFVSQHVEQMLGYTVEEWLATPNFWLTIVHPEDREAAGRRASEAFTSGKGGPNHFRWVTKDARTLWVEARAVVIADKDGRPVGMRGVTMDVSERKRGEEERRVLLVREQEARRRAEDANRIKDDFLSTLSHELRTPLNAILGWAGLLESGALDPAARERAVASIQRNAHAQSQIVEDLLDVSRIITGKLRLESGPVDLMHVIEAAIDSVRLAAEAKRIRIEPVFSDEASTTWGDPDRLQQVVWNLLTNAVKFTPAGGRVEIRLEAADSDAVIEVRDTGGGIEPEFLSYVFDRFRQADSTTTRAHGGLGLGLALVRHLVELHGGTVAAANAADGTGAVLTVRLPKQRMGDRYPRALDAPIEKPGVPSAELAGVTILVVDDEADAREVLALALTRTGAMVKTAANAADAFALASTGHLDIVIADIGMPGEDGYSLIRRLREAPATRELPAVALTAYAGDGNRQRAIQAGFDDHMSKPVNAADLIVVVERLAASRQRRDGVGKAT